MTVRVDPIDNLVGRYGADPNAPALLLASHLDTVVNAGRYDGILRILLALIVEVFQVRQKAGAQSLPYALEVVEFSEEEGGRYRTPFFGSRVLSGQWDTSLP